MAKRPLDTGWAGRIASSKDKLDDYQRIILLGDYGSGKTKLGADYPKPFVLAAEDGMLTLHKEDIPYVKIDPDKAVYQTVLDMLATAAQKEGPFEDRETLVMDSMSRLNRLVLDEILDDAGKEKPEFDEWAKLRSRMNRINNLFIRLPFHCIATCSEAVKDDKLEGEERPTFNIEGGFRNDFPGDYDHVWYMYKKIMGRKEVFMMNTVNYQGRKVKTRVNLPAEIEDPKYNTIIKFMKENN